MDTKRGQATILQLNIGLYCNQACSHCHVESSPKRTEMMDRRTASRCLDLLKASPSIRTLDITGGAPELNSQFRYLIEEASATGVEIIDRCNLTVLVEPGQEDLADFLAQHKVRAGVNIRPANNVHLAFVLYNINKGQPAQTLASAVKSPE
jgi:radical SAM/Cys-rich protein